MSTPRLALVAITRHGVRCADQLAARLEGAELFVPERFEASHATVTRYRGSVAAVVPELFARFDQIVFFVALGAVVRLIAPLVRAKDLDPAIVVVDEAGRFAVPVLSGHRGGANDCAERIATLLGATPVLTTAAEVRGTIAVDRLGRELGWRIEATERNLTRVAAQVVNDEPVALVLEEPDSRWWSRPTPPPANITVFDRIEEVDPAVYRALLWLTRRKIPDALRQTYDERIIVYRPAPADAHAALVIAGIGCDRDTPIETLAMALDQALAATGVARAAIRALATIDRKADEAGIRELAARHDWPVHYFAAAELARVPVPTPSATVQRYMGTPSVAAAAAVLAAAASVAELLIEKHKLRGACGRNATIALARIPHD